MLERLGEVIFIVGCFVMGFFDYYAFHGGQTGNCLVAAALAVSVGWSIRYILSGRVY